MYAINAEGLSKTYEGEGAPVRVFTDLSFALEPGVFAAVMGPSGVGKSTLLHLLGGIDRADSGRVEVLGQSLEELPARERARFRNERIGFVFQFHHLLPEFTAQENVAFPHRIAGLTRRESERRAGELLERVGLAERGHHRSRALSGGEQQRVAIARALARGPSLLLADEPTGNLDAESARSVFDLLEELHRERGMTTVLVTHNPDLANRCDKIFLMSREGIKAAEPSQRPLNQRGSLRSPGPLNQRGTSRSPGPQNQRGTSRSPGPQNQRGTLRSPGPPDSDREG